MSEWTTFFPLIPWRSATRTSGASPNCELTLSCIYSSCETSRSCSCCCCNWQTISKTMMLHAGHWAAPIPADPWVLKTQSRISWWDSAAWCSWMCPTATWRRLPLEWCWFLPLNTCAWRTTCLQHFPGPTRPCPTSRLSRWKATNFWQYWSLPPSATSSPFVPCESASLNFTLHKNFLFQLS